MSRKIVQLLDLPEDRAVSALRRGVYGLSKDGRLWLLRYSDSIGHRWCEIDVLPPMTDAEREKHNADDPMA